MKAQELAYGNLVSYLGRTHVVESPNATKTWASPILKNGTLGAVELLDNDKIEPLPVTPENLALVGFVYEESNKWYVLLANKNVQVFLSKRNVWVLTSNRIIIDVESIHRLQNILQSNYGITVQYNEPQP